MPEMRRLGQWMLGTGVGLRPGGNLIKYKSNPDPRTLGPRFCSLGASQRREAGKGSDGQWLVSPLCEAMIYFVVFNIQVRALPDTSHGHL